MDASRINESLEGVSRRVLQETTNRAESETLNQVKQSSTRREERGMANAGHQDVSQDDSGSLPRAQ